MSTMYMSRLLPLRLPLPGTRRRQAPQHYALLPPSLLTPAFHPVTRISDYWTHLDSITCVITSPVSVCSQALFPASGLMFTCLRIPGSDAVLVDVCSTLNVQLPIPTSLLQRQSLQYKYGGMNRHLHSGYLEEKGVDAFQC